MKKVKIINYLSKPFIFLILIITMAGMNVNENSFTLSASGWDEYNGYEFMLVKLNRSKPGGVDTMNIVRIENGSFTMKGTVNSPMKVYFGVIDGQQQKTKGDFLLESGNLIIKKKGEGRNAQFYIENGKYNDIVVNSWLLNEEYKKKQEELNTFMSGLNKEDYEKEEVGKKYYAMYQEAEKVKRDISAELVKTHKDPLVRLLAMNNAGLSIPEAEKVLDELGKNEYIAKSEAYKSKRMSYQRQKERRAKAAEVGVGKMVKNFSGKNIDGKEFFLEKVLQENKYVLVEFWASWCGPCRAEIPHMKEAYERFQNKGFEIVSFSLDHDRGKWVKASDKEELPWINISDLLAYQSPVAKMYGVNGIPANYLVDRSGKIIARDLRQKKLDEKLEELLKN